MPSLFFIIMIADIDENMNISISRLFADDTKVSAIIRSQEDRATAAGSQYDIQLGR